MVLSRAGSARAAPNDAPKQCELFAARGNHTLFGAVGGYYAPKSDTGLLSSAALKRTFEWLVTPYSWQSYKWQHVIIQFITCEVESDGPHAIEQGHISAISPN